MPMNKARKLTLLAAVVAALATAAVAAAGTNLSLVAYSTPKTVMGKIIQAWQQTPDGKDVIVQPVVRRLDRPGARRRPGAEGGRRLPLHRRRREPARRRRPRRLEVEPPELRRHRRRHRRRLRRPERQPEAHQGLGRPGQAGRAGRDAEPVQLRLREVERPRRLRRGAPPRQDRQAGDRVRAEALPARRLAGHLGPERDEHVPRRQGRRPHHLRERGVRGAAERPGHPVRDPAPVDADRAPDRGAQGLVEQGRREQVHPLRQERHRAGSLRASTGSGR